MQIPEDLREFLHWVKDRTETIWQQDSFLVDDDMHKYSWLRDAKWQGLTPAEIDALEIKYNIKFTPDHRLFLEILHTIDKLEPYEYTESPEEDADVFIEHHHFFYNWNDEQTIEEKSHWAYDTIFYDVAEEDGVWLKSWGERPKNKKEQEKIFAEWYNKAPKLLPIKAHRFIVSEPLASDNPILSIWGSDTIVYGWNLKSYLLREIGHHLSIYDSEADDYRFPEINEMFETEWKLAKEKDIPSWKELILYWSSGWSSFGLEYPYPEDNPNMIVKADDNAQPRNFSDHSDKLHENGQE